MITEIICVSCLPIIGGLDLIAWYSCELGEEWSEEFLVDHAVTFTPN